MTVASSYCTPKVEEFSQSNLLQPWGKLAMPVGKSDGTKLGKFCLPQRIEFGQSLAIEHQKRLSAS